MAHARPRAPFPFDLSVATSPLPDAISVRSVFLILFFVCLLFLGNWDGPVNEIIIVCGGQRLALIAYTRPVVRRRRTGARYTLADKRRTDKPFIHCDRLIMAGILIDS